MKAAQRRGPPASAIEIAHVPAMFAVHAMTHACEFRGRQCIQARQVAGVDHFWLQPPAHLEKFLTHLPDAYPRSVQGENLGVRTCDALAEFGIILDAGYGVS